MKLKLFLVVGLLFQATHSTNPMYNDRLRGSVGQYRNPLQACQQRCKDNVKSTTYVNHSQRGTVNKLNLCFADCQGSSNFRDLGQGTFRAAYGFNK